MWRWMARPRELDWKSGESVCEEGSSGDSDSTGRKLYDRKGADD